MSEGPRNLHGPNLCLGLGGLGFRVEGLGFLQMSCLILGVGGI